MRNRERIRQGLAARLLFVAAVSLSLWIAFAPGPENKTLGALLLLAFLGPLSLAPRLVSPAAPSDPTRYRGADASVRDLAELALLLGILFVGMLVFFPEGVSFDPATTPLRDAGRTATYVAWIAGLLVPTLPRLLRCLRHAMRTKLARDSDRSRARKESRPSPARR